MGSWRYCDDRLVIDMTRRGLFAASAASLVTASTGDVLAHALSCSNPWSVTMRRCEQINLNEIDLPTVHAKAWINYSAVANFMQNLQSVPIFSAQHHHLLLSHPAKMSEPNKNFLLC